MKTEITKQQKSALLRMRTAIQDLHSQMKHVSNIWQELETLDAPIEFMNFQYPFNEKFDTDIENVEIWANDVSTKITHIIKNSIVL